ncbi:MAG: hypothetical protein MUF54_18280 [Polyangiaceae bacterium]|jgi:hypothetical protein|nr:hypothetical protein [Polyangiaceae bacterium]
MKRKRVNGCFGVLGFALMMTSSVAIFGCESVAEGDTVDLDDDGNGSAGRATAQSALLPCAGADLV